MLQQIKPTQTEKPLVCPVCDTLMWLTWKRYVSSPFGAQTCLTCGTRSRNNRPWWTHLFSALGFLPGLLVKTLLLALGVSGFAAFLGLVLVGGVCALVLDRHLDARLGKLVLPEAPGADTNNGTL